MGTTNREPDFSRVKAVFFDAGGTLFQPFPSVGKIYAEVAGRHGLRTDPRQLEERFHALWEERDGRASLSGHSSEKKEKEWWRSLVWDVFEKRTSSSKKGKKGDPALGKGAESGVTCPLFDGELDDFEAFFEELYHRFAGAESWRLYPDTLPTLRELKRQGKILGVVSNWDSRLFGICEGLGLTPYLDFVIASAVTGAAKPSLKIFQEALKQAQVPAEEAVHVGDSLEDDIRGAERAGICAIFVDRKGHRPRHRTTIPTLQFLGRMFVN